MKIVRPFLVYSICLSLLWSNIAWAGKGSHLSEVQDWEQPLTTIRPNTFSATSNIDALHIYKSGEIVAEDLEGNISAIKPYNQPQEIRDAIQHGHLMSLLDHFNLYVTKPGEELKIQLMGGLKGGMKKSGQPKLHLEIRPLGNPNNIPVSSGPFLTGGGHHIIEDHFYMQSVIVARQEAAIRRNISQALDRAIAQKIPGSLGLSEQEKASVVERARKICKTPEDTNSQEIIKQALQHLQAPKLARTQMTSALNDVTTKYPQSLLSNMAKKGVTPEFFPLWKSKQGQTFGTMTHLTYGYNIGDNPAVVNKQNGLSYPIFIDDRQLTQTNAFLPQCYKATYSQDKGLGDFILQRYDGNTLVLMDHIIGVPKDIHNPVRKMFPSNRGEINVVLTLGYGTTNAYQTLFIRSTYPALLDAIDSQKQQLGRLLRDLDGVLYNSRNPQPGRFGAFIRRSDVPPHMLPNIEAMKSFIGRNANGTINSSALALRPAVSNINGHIGMEDPYLKNGLVYSLFKEDRVQDGAYLPQGYQPNPEHERLGEALLRGYGRAVDQLLCETIGFCDANARGFALSLSKPMTATIGLSALTQWNGKVKNFVTNAVDWAKRPATILSTPIHEEIMLAFIREYGPTAIEAFRTFAEEVKPKILSGEITQVDFKDYINYKKDSGKVDHGGAPLTAHKNNTQSVSGSMNPDPDSDDEYKTTKHGVSRKIEREIKSADELDALKNPLKVKDVKIDINGLKSQRYIGKKVEVVINPDTKKIISVNKTHTKILEKLLK